MNHDINIVISNKKHLGTRPSLSTNKRPTLSQHYDSTSLRDVHTQSHRIPTIERYTMQINTQGVVEAD